MSYSITSIVYNSPTKIADLSPYIYRSRNCDTNMTSNTPANQYQKLKLIQNTVRVPSSLYTMNLGALSAYSNPVNNTYNVYWNQMSDRRVPSVQKTIVPSGINSSLNRKHYSVTSSRPGGQSPGGIGCDIKHNSYDRYLNKIKAKNPLRRGEVPSNFGNPIDFNCAYPIYGGKTLKTSIVNSCDCPITTSNTTYKNSIPLYYNPFYQEYPSTILSFNVGDTVYAIKSGTTYYTKATILQKNDDNTYNVEFDDGTTENNVNITYLKVYFPCDCNGTQVSLSTVNTCDSSDKIYLYPDYVYLKNSLN